MEEAYWGEVWYDRERMVFWTYGLSPRERDVEKSVHGKKAFRGMCDGEWEIGVNLGPGQIGGLEIEH